MWKRTNTYLTLVTTWRPVVQGTLIQESIARYQPDVSICPFTRLKAYIKRTDFLRKDETRSWQGLAGNPLGLFRNITISLSFKKTECPLLFWALVHTRLFVMSTLDLVGISKLASLHMRKKKKKKDYDVLYTEFIIGVAFARGYSCIWPWVICTSRWAYRMGASTQ